MSAVALAPALAMELWVSFVALVRSYASVAGWDSGVGVEVKASGESVVLSAGAVECLMGFAPESGAVVWGLREHGEDAAAGRFVMLPEGRIAQDGAVMDMDSVAIDMVARVRDRSQAGREGRR